MVHGAPWHVAPSECTAWSQETERRCFAVQYPLCLNLMASKKVDVMPLITHRFGFTPEDVAAAFDCAARSAETRAIKVMFNLP